MVIERSLHPEHRTLPAVSSSVTCGELHASTLAEQHVDRHQCSTADCHVGWFLCGPCRAPSRLIPARVRVRFSRPLPRGRSSFAMPVVGEVPRGQRSVQVRSFAANRCRLTAGQPLACKRVSVGATSPGSGRLLMVIWEQRMPVRLRPPVHVSFLRADCAALSLQTTAAQT